MTRPCLAVLLAGLALTWAAPGAAFRNCDLDNSDAFNATTHYLVGEIEFDAATGLASGTQTNYNYANTGAGSFTECHITYELTGSYNPATASFVLDATRSNHSAGCPSELIDVSYPTTRLQSLQMTFTAKGDARVNSADSGEFLAEGAWADGRTAFKTAETCIFF